MEEYSNSIGRHAAAPRVELSKSFFSWHAKQVNYLREPFNLCRIKYYNIQISRYLPQKKISISFLIISLQSKTSPKLRVLIYVTWFAVVFFWNFGSKIFGKTFENIRIIFFAFLQLEKTWNWVLSLYVCEVSAHSVQK